MEFLGDESQTPRNLEKARILDFLNSKTCSKLKSLQLRGDGFSNRHYIETISSLDFANGLEQLEFVGSLIDDEVVKSLHFPSLHTLIFRHCEEINGAFICPLLTTARCHVSEVNWLSSRKL